MKINDIYESTTSGSVASVAMPLGKTQKRGGNLLTGKKTSKKYANSVNESKMKQVAMDLETMQDGNFKQKYKKTKEQMVAVLGTPANMKPKSKAEVNEAHLEEDDLILVPGQGHRLKSGFIPHDQDRTDHEVEMAKSDLFQAAKNAKQVYEIIADVSEEEGLPGWVQEKIIKANDYLNTIREYLEGKQVQEMHGGVGEGIVDKIKGAVRREKAKDLPLVQTRRDYAMGKGGEAYNKGETRKGNQYMAYAEKDRKKMGDPTTNPAGTYRTKTSDYTNEGAMTTKQPKGEKPWKPSMDRPKGEYDPILGKAPRKGTVAYNAWKSKREAGLKGDLSEAQSMGGALKNSLAKAEPGSKLDQSIKRHNANIKAGQAGTLKNAPTGYHFDKKGYCRLGDK